MQLLSANNDNNEKHDAWTCTEAVDCQQSNSAVNKSEKSSSNTLYEINVSLNLEHLQLIDSLIQHIILFYFLIDN